MTDAVFRAPDVACREWPDGLVGDLSDRAPSGHLDAMFASPGGAAGLTPPWRTFWRLACMGPGGDALARGELIARLDELQLALERRLDDNGVTYNLYSDTASQTRPWSLDLLPMIVSERDWQSIERGVAQRASLLNAILADVYGEQHLLRDGLLPTALVQGNPAFLRPAAGVKPLGGTYLHIAAFDLACGPDGRWWVVSQRVQAPSGLGYLLENRMIVSRLFPEAFHALRIERVVGAYKALLASLQSHSKAGSNARIVLLTPGPYNETYFEHAYLARYLGITLAEGGDLVVRNERLWLKTLAGLEQVDVVLRRLDDDFLDPLELRADSALGVPGIMQAWRAGNVVMANAPGGGFLESTAILAFLPAIAERLQGRPLELPSIASWWCGERAVLPAMLPEIERLVIKPTYGDRARRFVPVIGTQLNASERARWVSRILAQPDNHTTQAYLPLQHNPSWRGGSAEARGERPIGSRAAMVRVFALSDGEGAWRVLPGGLARIAPEGKAIVSMYRGGSSADVWVATGRARQDTSPLAPNWTPLAEARSTGIPSRAAENLFWFGRYTERLENAVRIARLVLEALASNDEELPATQSWLSVLAVNNGLVPSGAPRVQDDERAFRDALLASLPDREGRLGAWSVSATLESLRVSAFAVRERLATEQWSLVERSAHEFRDLLSGAGAGGPPSSQRALRALERLATQVMAMTGAQLDRMTRDDGWRLLSVGRQIERLYTLSEALADAFATGTLATDTGFALVLQLFDSTITYRARYLQRRDPRALLQLLVLDRDNPRALAWVSDTLMARLAKLPGAASGDRLAREGQPLPHQWAEDSLRGLITRHALGDAMPLVALLRGVVQTAGDLSDAISQRYFSHAVRSQTVGA